MSKTPAPSSYYGYSDQTGNPLKDDVNQWFAHGVKRVEEPVQKNFCTTKQTFYVFLSILSIVILLLVIIIPGIVGSVYKSS